MFCPRTVPVLCLAACTLVSTRLAAEPPPSGRDPHVRCLDASAAALLRDVAERSPTVRRLVHALDRSDVVAYVTMDPYLSMPTAFTRFMSFVAGTRYLLITINAKNDGATRAACLGHELQHAVEVSRAPEARDAAGFEVLYRHIGFESGHAGGGDDWETAEAQQVGTAVRTEYASGRALAGGASDAGGTSR